MAGRGSGPDFVEALARGLDILGGFEATDGTMSLSEVATAADLARPTARRLLLTLQEMGYVRSVDGGFQLTPKVMSLGMGYVSSLGLWDIARPHLEALVCRTGESSSMAQLDGSDIVYVARVSVPKIIALRVSIGTRFPAAQTSQGKVLLADLSTDALEETLAQPSRAGLPPYIERSHDELLAELSQVRARGWALADEELAPGVRSVAVPVRDGTGAVRAAMNVTVHAAETPTEVLLERHLPTLLRTAGDVSAEWALWQSRPHTEVEVDFSTA
jgi:IclR family pca regulon transcriptional regulator